MKEWEPISRYLLVFLFYLKFLIQILLNVKSPWLDIPLYLLLLTSFNYRKVNLIVFGIFYFALISLLNSAARNVFLIFLTIYTLRIWSVRQFAIVNLFVSLIFFIVTVFLLYGDVLHSKIFSFSLLNYRERWDFGYGNPNTFALFIFSILVNSYIVFVGKFKNVILPVMLLVGFVVYSYTGSRTFFISIIVLIIIHYSIIYQNGFLLIKKTLVYFPFVVILFLLFLIFNVSDFAIVNLVLSGRLDLYNSFILKMSLLDFFIGSSIINDAETVIDSSYLHLLFECGIFGLLIFLVSYIKMMKYIDIHMKYYLPVVVSILFYGITESLFTYVLIFGNMILWFILSKSIIVNKVSE